MRLRPLQTGEPMATKKRVTRQQKPPMSAPPLSSEQMRLRRALKSTVARFDDEGDRLNAAGLPAPQDDERAAHRSQLEKAKKQWKK